MATINGSPVVFGFGAGAGITITGLNGILLQSKEHSLEAERSLVRDGAGNRVTSTHYDQIDKATLRYKVSGSSLSDALVNTAIQAPGTILAITACAKDAAMVGTNWEVQSGARLSQSNTGEAEMEIPLEKASGITAAAS